MATIEKQTTIQSHKLRLFYPEKPGKYPLYYIFAHEDHDAERLLELVDDLELIMGFIRVADWNDSMTPWAADSLFRRQPDFTGQADHFITELSEISDWVAEELRKAEVTIGSRHAVGFSLSGIFSLYLASQKQNIQSVIAVSPSAWYDGILQYFRDCSMPESLKAIYLSLGIQEADHSNDKIASVEDRTQALKDIFLDQDIEVFLAFDQGDHFSLMHRRMAEGIYWSFLATKMLSS